MMAGAASARPESERHKLGSVVPCGERQARPIRYRSTDCSAGLVASSSAFWSVIVGRGGMPQVVLGQRSGEGVYFGHCHL